ncbi:MAG: hypothetical protein HYV07_23295 [Deltaproteobacteria bacterium]|nr:hypothetical protein [Deltaproteobacteria bacterium]
METRPRARKDQLAALEALAARDEVAAASYGSFLELAFEGKRADAKARLRRP